MFGTLFLLLIILLLLLGTIFTFTPNSQPVNKKNTEENSSWEYQKEQVKKESAAEKNKEWFSSKRWLTDKEIDWACERMEENKPMTGTWPDQPAPNKFKILPAHQFHYVREANKKEAQTHLALTELLSDINDQSKELVFIPVNNPNFHWSLLVYEVKTQTFYHWDTLNGANYQYIKPLVKELCQQIQQANSISLPQLLIKRHDIQQGNGYDCGVAVITIIKRVREKYQRNLKEIDLGEFDFSQDRQILRKEYLTEHGN